MRSLADHFLHGGGWRYFLIGLVGGFAGATLERALS